MGVTRKQSPPNFLKNKHFLPPDTQTQVWVSGGMKCSLFGKFGELCFLVTPVLKFVLLPCYRRTQETDISKTCRFGRMLEDHENNVANRQTGGRTKPKFIEKFRWRICLTNHGDPKQTFE